MFKINTFRFLLRRLTTYIPVILLVTIFVYLLVYLIPGNPAIAILGEHATPEQIEKLEEQLGLDKPVYTQYWLWLKNVSKGDLGRSLMTRHPVFERVISRLWVSLTVIAFALLLSIVISLGLALASVFRPNGALDLVSRFIASCGAAAPPFWVALIFIMIFGVALGWLPTSGYLDPGKGLRSIKYLIMPAVTLGLPVTALLSRHLRSSLLETFNRDYIRTAFSKGLSERKVILRHSLKNALLPVITTIGTQFSRMMGGAVLIENIFAIPGLGQLAIASIIQKDFPMIQGVVLFTTLAVLTTSLLVDIIYAAVDPRIRY